MTTIKELKSGTRLAVCEMKGFEGVSFKMYIYTGSGNEKKEEDYGISHLIEHMFFKGTKTRSSYQIANELDKLGIQSNAFTSKEQTCYYTYGTNDTLEKSVEVLSDMFFNSVFDEEELEREKQVVIEEINMYQDKPDIVCEMALESLYYNGTNYAHDIIGTKESVLNTTRAQILKYINKHYTPKNIVLSFAGNVTQKKAEELVNKYFEPFFKKQEKFEYNLKEKKLKINNNEIKVKKDTKQAQLSICYNSVNRANHKLTIIKDLISQMLGSGMSSRLFQEVREKLGLVYSIQTFNDANNIAGPFFITLGTNYKKVPLALKTIKKVINDIVINGFTLEELKQAKNMSISALRLRSDNPSNMASMVANFSQYRNKIYSKEELIKDYQQITLNEVNDYTKTLFNDKEITISMVSKKDDIDLLKEYLK